MSGRSVRSIVDEVFSYYEEYGGEDYVGERVTQLQHAQQVCQLARNAGGYKEIEAQKTLGFNLIFLLVEAFHTVTRLLLWWVRSDDPPINVSMVTDPFFFYHPRCVFFLRFFAR